MAWASLASNQWISRNDLQDAVTTGVFLLRPSQSIPAGNNFVTRLEVETWIYATVSTGASNQWPQKSWLTPIVVTTTSTTSTSTTTTTTTLSPTTTTTTTVHVPSFVVNVHNDTSDVNINQVHGTGGYVGPFSYPLLPGQDATDNNWPMAQFNGSGGIYTIKQSSPSGLYHLDVYMNSILVHQENGGPITDSSQYHFSFGFSPVGEDGDVVDIYLLPGNI